VAGKTYFQSDRVLDLFLGVTVIGAPATYVNLFVTNPTGDNQAGVEWAAARVEVLNALPSPNLFLPYWGAKKSDGNLRYVDNVYTISWTMADAATYVDHETVVGIGVWDASVLGHLLYWEELEKSVAMQPEEEIAFGTGALRVRED